MAESGVKQKVISVEIDLTATEGNGSGHGDLEADIAREVRAENESAGTSLEATAESCHRPYGLQAIPEHVLEGTAGDDLEGEQPAEIGLETTADKEPAEIDLEATADKDIETTADKDLETTAYKEPSENDLEPTADKEPASDLKTTEEEENEPPITACHFGGWFPKDPGAVDRYLKRLIQKVYKTCDLEEITDIEKKCDAMVLPLHPSLQEFKQIIESNPEIFKYFNLMFTQIPDPFRQIPNYDVMLRLLNLAISMAPPYYSSELVGVPMAAIMLRPMLTPAGNNAFMNDKVHQAFKKVLNAWCVYLKSPDSKNVLDTESGWLSEDAMYYMPDFKSLYMCNPNISHYGFESWDDFFVRKFQEGVRPIAYGEDVIANACESAPLVVRRDVQLRERFWIKDQPYSLGFMLAGDPLTDNYVGGTVYQAFLSQFNYHRWHSPVNGTIVKAYNVDGSYFAECLREGYHSLSIAYSQCYITSMATRCLIFIKADNPHIGTIVFVGIGMTEVSSCDITTFEGQKVKKGDEIGMFHYGGSSHCLVFEHGVDIHFVQEPSEPDMTSEPLDVCAKLGQVFHD